MKKFRNQRGPERLSDAISCRISASQRAYIEKMAVERDIDLGAAIRELLNAGIEARCVEC